MATLFAAIIVYQGWPFAATTIPNGWLPLTTFASVITPAFVMLAMFPFVVWVNHMDPSGAAVTACGPSVVRGKMVTVPVAGSRRPTACGVNLALNHPCPSVATAMPRAG